MNRLLAYIALCLSSYCTYKIVKLYLNAKVSRDLPMPTWKEWLIAIGLTLIPPSIAICSLVYLVETL